MEQNAITLSVPSQDQFDRWMASLPVNVAKAVRAHSPFVPHRLKSTGQTVYIARFQEGFPGGPQVTVSVIAPRAANPKQATDLEFEGIDPEELYSLAS